MSRQNQSKNTYIYDLPFKQRRELCNILDENDKWQDLAEIMQIPNSKIISMRREKGPTEALLVFVEQKNHTIQELFVQLSRMEHYRAMIVLKDQIDVKYHSLIKEGDDSITRLLSSFKMAAPKAKEMNVSQSIAKVYEDGDLNIKGNYESIPRKKEEKKLNINIPSISPVNANEDGARGISPGKASLSAESPGKNHSRESNVYTEDIKRTLSEIPFHELCSATNDWNVKNILGKGGFGTVYEGEWKQTRVAVKVFKKRLDTESSEKQNEAQIEQLIKEFQVLDSIRHDNILPVYGYSFGDGLFPCIVYQLMENGSLEDRLIRKKETPPLTWFQRYDIARGTARGLQFLHTKGERPLIHGDIKSANILLDGNMKPYIGDFGLAREGPIPTLTHMTVLNVNGTKMYLPHDYLTTRQISTKVDTYSFGIVLFEIATGRRAFDRKHKVALKDLLSDMKADDLIDPFTDQANSIISKGIGKELISIGKWCAQDKAKDRPEVVAVLQALDKMNVPSSRPTSAATSYSHLPPSPMELQRHYDSLNYRQRTISGDSWNGGRPMYYPFAASPSINIQEFPNSTPSTIPTQNPFPSPSPSNFRHSPNAFMNDFMPMSPPLLMVQPPIFSQAHNFAPPGQFFNSPLLLDQQQTQNIYQPEPIQEQSEMSGTQFIPTVLPGMSSKEHASSQESNFNVPLITALGIKVNANDDNGLSNSAGGASDEDNGED